MAAVLAAAFTLLSGAFLSGGAQTVMGQLFDAETGAPVEGALVRLLRGDGTEAGGYLTNSAGRFLLQAPTPGDFTLQAERIGYKTVTSDPFRLDQGQQLGIRLETTATAIELEELRVEGSRRCVVRPEEGARVYAVWEEARKALAVQDWTDREGTYRFEMVAYERELGPEGRVVQSERRTRRSGISDSPIRSLPAEELLTQGFIREDDSGGWDYYGPDASVMLSDLFLDTHCFSLEFEGGGTNEVGLAFEPVQRSGMPDIQGTLWIDLSSGELKVLEYRYTWSPWESAQGVAGGRVEFEFLPSGAWIVRKWWIRMPLMAADFTITRTGGSRIRVVGVKEVGGEITRYSTLEREILSRAPTATIEGEVWDMTRQQPLVGATVFLSGTSHASETDREGRFLLSGLPEGVFRAAFTHPRLDSLGVFPEGVEVDMVPGDTTRVTLSVPPEADALASVCPEGEWKEDATAIMGLVRDSHGGGPVPGATVHVVWSEVEGGSVRTLAERRMEALVTTDANGRYVVCGIPPEALVTLVVAVGEQEGTPVQLRTGEEGVTVRNLEFNGGAYPIRS